MTLKMSLKQFKEMQKEFMRFGYDPYNSHEINEWFACMKVGLTTP